MVYNNFCNGSNFRDQNLAKIIRLDDNFVWGDQKTCDFYVAALTKFDDISADEYVIVRNNTFSGVAILLVFFG